MKKKIFALVASLLMIASPALADGQVGEQFVFSPPGYSDPAIGVLIEDSQFIKNQFTIMQSWGPRQFGESMQVSDLTACKSYGEKNCGDADFIFYKNSFGYCSSQTVSYTHLTLPTTSRV